MLHVRENAHVHAVAAACGILCLAAPAAYCCADLPPNAIAPTAIRTLTLLAAMESRKKSRLAELAMPCGSLGCASPRTTRCGRSGVRLWFVSRKTCGWRSRARPSFAPHGAKRAANAGFSATMLTTSAYSPKRWRGNFHKAGLSYTTNNARSFAYQAAPCTWRT